MFFTDTLQVNIQHTKILMCLGKISKDKMGL